MAINIIVEDGTIVPNANSFVTIEEARLYAMNRGVILDANDDIVAAFMIEAVDYLNSKENCYKGERISEEQELCFPRTEFKTLIPKALKNAQMQAVIERHNGFDLLPTTSPTDYVIEETVGPLTTKYADPVAVGQSTNFASLDALLEPLCKYGGIKLRTVRV